MAVAASLEDTLRLVELAPLCSFEIREQSNEIILQYTLVRSSKCPAPLPCGVENNVGNGPDPLMTPQHSALA